MTDAKDYLEGDKYTIKTKLKAAHALETNLEGDNPKKLVQTAKHVIKT